VPLIGVLVGVDGIPSAGSDPGGGGGTTDPTPVNPLAVTLTSPEDQDTVAVSYPTFVVGVDTSLENPLSTYTLILQYADNLAMTNPVQMTADFEGTDAGAFLTPSAAVPATTYWRARVVQGDTWRSAWTDVASFTVNNVTSPVLVPITWTVADSADRPIHVWHLVPPAQTPGNTVMIYGQGFPASGKVLFDGVPITVTSWSATSVPASSGDANRVIDGDNVYPSHYEVVIIVPSYTGPGAALTVSA
jgi:hypothetical protein